MKYILLFFVVIFLGACDSTDNEMEANNTNQNVESVVKDDAYNSAVKEFNKVSLEEVNNKISKDESFFLYTGRESCPYCQKFVPKLSNVVSKTDIQVNYLDTEQMSEELEEFMMIHEIAFVPSFIYFDKNTNIRIDSLDSEAISEGELEDFITTAMK